MCTFRAAAFNPQLDGTMMPYQFSPSDTIKPWGDDLKPIFVDYIARHGARFLSSEKKIISIREELLKAKAGNRITECGLDFLNLCDTIIKKTANRWGALDELGMDEENRLGSELVTLCPELFKEGNVSAVSSYVPRVVMSMYEVCHALARHSSYLEIDAAEGRRYDSLLRYFTTDPTYVEYLESGIWRKIYDDFVKRNVPEAPASRMITGISNNSELRKLSMEAYGILQSLDATGISVDASKWFSEEEYYLCWEADNLQHYLQRSANPYDSSGINAAKPLLRDIISSAEDAFSGKSASKAKLRFGHAETVIPLWALMRLPGCYAPKTTPDDLASQWKDWKVSPLGANLLMVCLRDTLRNNFVALRLNGTWVEMDGEKVVSWEKVKAEWGTYL